MAADKTDRETVFEIAALVAAAVEAAIKVAVVTKAADVRSARPVPGSPKGDQSPKRSERRTL